MAGRKPRISSGYFLSRRCITVLPLGHLLSSHKVSHHNVDTASLVGTEKKQKKQHSLLCKFDSYQNWVPNENNTFTCASLFTDHQKLKWTTQSFITGDPQFSHLHSTAVSICWVLLLVLAPSKYQHMAAQSLNIGTRVLLLLPLSISLCQPREGAVPSCQCNLVTHDWPLWHYARHALMVMQLHVHVHDLHVWPPHACHEIVAFWECNYYLHWIRQVKPFRCFSKFFPWRNKCHFDRDICIKLKEIVMCHSFAAVFSCSSYGLLPTATATHLVLSWSNTKTKSLLQISTAYIKMAKKWLNK